MRGSLTRGALSDLLEERQSKFAQIKVLRCLTGAVSLVPAGLVSEEVPRYMGSDGVLWEEGSIEMPRTGKEAFSGPTLRL